MNRTRHFASCLWLCLTACSLSLYSQEKIKFGKVDPADLSMTVCSFDSVADAMVLSDIGESYFSYDQSEGFSMYFERHLRIKIFSKNGYSAANVEIPYYHTEQDKEAIITLKGKTFNLANGKVAETGLDDDMVFEEEIDAYWKQKKISFPAVREGSVIDLKYTIKSPFFSRLRDWYFQGTLPVRLSDYRVGIPEFFKYDRKTGGFSNFTVNENTETPKHINQVSLERGGDQYNVTHSVSQSTLDYTDYETHLACNNMPAFREEPFTSSPSNYLSKVEFDFHGYQFPRQALHTFNASWEEVTENLLKDEDFGTQLGRGGLVKEMVAVVRAGAASPSDQLIMAHKLIASQIKWNGRYSKYSSSGLKKALDNKAGNSADVNLALILLLRELGIRAEPVVVSTRKNGAVLKSRVSIDRLNNVIALATIDGKEYLLDATSSVRPWSMIPFECLNGDGLVVSKESVRWIPLLRGEKNTSMMYAEMALQPSGELTGKLETTESGYNAVSTRNDYRDEGEEKSKKAVAQRLKSWEISTVSWKNMDNISEPVSTSCLLSSSDIAQTAGDMIYLNPLLNLGQSANPFRQEKRSYPVDFGCPLKDTYSFALEIPEGYHVESAPAAASFALPDNAGSFRFAVTQVGNKLSVNSTLNISRVSFEQADYEILREFFNQVVKKHAEQVVLKKG